MFMVGFDFQLKEEVKKIYNFCINNKVTAPLLYIVTPPPGTPMYDKYYADKRIDEADISKYNLFNLVFKPLDLTKEDFMNLFWFVYKDMYSLKNIYKRILLKKTPFVHKMFQLFINLFIHRNLKKKNQVHINK